MPVPGGTGSQQKHMKLFKSFLVGAVALVAISFLVPEYSVHPEESIEKLATFNLSASGTQLVLRTAQHDYEFVLPANQLNAVFAKAAPDADGFLLGGRAGAFIDPLVVDPTGATTSSLTVRFGGYDSRLSETKSILSAKERASLAALGFSPSNGNVCCEIDPPLYMAWTAELAGHQYLPGSRVADPGIDLGSMSNALLDVTADDPEALQRNRQINGLLRPFVALREGLQQGLFVVLLLVTGTNPFPGG